MKDLDKKVALVTGASSGIGKVMAEFLSENGYYVYAAARRVEQINPDKKKYVEGLYMDVTDRSSINNAISKITADKGKIDLLINNAGYGIYGSVEGLPQEHARKAFDVNLFGLGSVIQETLPVMRKHRSGIIINISSLVGKVSMPVLGWYGASKHAVEGLTDALRLEVKPFGINVVLIQPGTIVTEFEDVAMATLEKSTEPKEYLPLKNSFSKLVRSSYKKAPGAEVVIKELKKIIRTKNPRPRYAAGSDAKTFLFLKKWFSDRLVDKLMGSMYKN